MHLGSDFAHFSEYALISLKVLPDFDSTIRRFESSRPSQAVMRPEKVSSTLAERRANGGLLRFSGRSPNAQFGHFRREMADDLRRIFEIFPFLGDATGDRVRSGLRGGRGDCMWRLAEKTLRKASFLVRLSLRLGQLPAKGAWVTVVLPATRPDRTGAAGDGLLIAFVRLLISRTILIPGYYRTTKEDKSLTQDCVNDGYYQGYFSLRVHLLVTPMRYRIRQLPDCRFRW
jgi:hypothetical protein